MNHEEILKLIRGTNGKIFTIRFRKTTGELRKMNCRTGVHKHLKGGSLSYNPAEVGNVIVFDLKKKDYRSFSLNRLLSFRCGPVTWEAAKI